MQRLLVFGVATLIGTAAVCTGAAADMWDGPDRVVTIAPNRIHGHHQVNRPLAEPVDIPLDPLGAVGFRTPFTTVETPYGLEVLRIPHRQGPDGTYDDLGDLTQSIQGTPCGQECTARSLVRWGYAPY
jgi:hypothetical protein